MTSPFYLRRDFSIPLTGLKSRGLMSLDAEPGPDSLFYKLWDSCTDIATREIKQSLSSANISDTFARKVGCVYDICIEDSSNDFNDIYLNIAAWSRKG